jgi:hypothetical protein
MQTPSHAEIWVQFLPTANGGRKSAANLEAGYRPHLRVAGGDRLGVEFVGAARPTLHPGEGCTAEVRFLYEPGVSYECLAVGVAFEILEGPNIVGAGHVSHVKSEGPQS